MKEVRFSFAFFYFAVFIFFSTFTPFLLFLSFRDGGRAIRKEAFTSLKGMH